MVVFVNGKFISDKDANVPVSDRCFLYGDGVFETLRIYDGRPFLLPEHLQRLERGAAFLKIRIPLSTAQLSKAAFVVLKKNKSADAVLRLQVSRGVGTRGYSPLGANSANLVMTLHALPPKRESIRLITSSFRLPGDDPLALIKSCNKLRQTVARAEADAAGMDDALLLNSDKKVAETTSCNLFWINKDIVYTPPIRSGILPGLTRSAVMELCKTIKVRCSEKLADREALLGADGVFATSSVNEVVEVSELDNQRLDRSAIVHELSTLYHKLVKTF